MDPLPPPDVALSISYEARAKAVALYCDAIVRMHWGERLINKIFGRAMQSHAAGRIVVQHYRWKEEGAERPTLALLQRNASRGTRTLASFVAVLRLTGMVTAEADAGDRRVRYLVPQERLVAGLRAWIAHHLRCCEALGLLDAGHAARLADDPAFFSAFVSRAGRILDQVALHRGRFGGWTWFDDRDGGGRLAMLLLRDHFKANPVACSPLVAFPLRARELAEGLGLSHSHVRGVLKEAIEAGHLAHDAGRAQVRLTPRFQDEMMSWLLHFLSWFADAAHAARRAC
ncbi:hypothetical protein [Variovorax paradoxus]|uniref:Uncharacterized protein n=1 Tax=Variovorax paradoxus TaxID=34073 RepID=A0A0H2LYY5_VARPD|nr:hypothetical protein [Variovorax paradoxus]KLN53682.1 hypothetical protein VPARA_52060 [Variovorax paradoxus]